MIRTLALVALVALLACSSPPPEPQMESRFAWIDRARIAEERTVDLPCDQWKLQGVRVGDSRSTAIDALEERGFRLSSLEGEAGSLFLAREASPDGGFVELDLYENRVAAVRFIATDEAAMAILARLEEKWGQGGPDDAMWFGSSNYNLQPRDPLGVSTLFEGRLWWRAGCGFQARAAFPRNGGMFAIELVDKLALHKAEEQRRDSILGLD